MVSVIFVYLSCGFVWAVTLNNVPLWRKAISMHLWLFEFAAILFHIFTNMPRNEENIKKGKKFYNKFFCVKENDQ